MSASPFQMSSDLREQTAPSSDSSYGQILRSSSIIGGAQAINYIVGLVRTKFVAVLLGPSGVGLVGLYVSIIGFIQTFAQFGINESGVREVAAAAGAKDKEKIAATVITLRRICWLTGTVGWTLAVVLAWPISQWAFGSTEHVWAIAALGITVLLELVSSGQKAVLQGVRRVGDLARIQIAFALLSTVMAVALYWWLREDGIVPVIILTSVTQLFASWWFARRVVISQVSQKWTETFIRVRGLIQLGSAFMYGALLAAAVGLAIRALIVRDLGLDAAGIYQAAWALSGMLASFILQAMRTDFYPRLTASIHDNKVANRLVNEQVEVGMLLALPAFVALAAFAPWVVKLLYSREFSESGTLLPWFLLGVLGQIVSWPVGTIAAAKGATGFIYFAQTAAAVLHMVLAIMLMKIFGFVGVAAAFGIFVWLQNLINQWVAHRLTAFAYGGECLLLGGVVAVIFLSAWCCAVFLADNEALVANALLVFVALFVSIRGLKQRVPKFGLLLEKYKLPFV